MAAGTDRTQRHGMQRILRRRSLKALRHTGGDGLFYRFRVAIVQPLTTKP